MPELPEVQTIVITLAPLVVGRMIGQATLKRADILIPSDINLPALLNGRVIRSVHRRAKRIIFTLDDQSRFYIHLGMTGRLTCESTTAEQQPHTHLLLDLDSGQQIRFRDPRRFGGVWWLGHELSPDTHLGPEPLTLRTRQLAILLSRTGRPIKNALLDQTVIAGLGNIYVDESLFAAGIHPLTPANTINLSRVALLNRSIKRILKKALRHRGSTLRDYFDANGIPGGFKKLHAVYDRAGDPCRRCKTPILRIAVAARSTHFCPSCQH